MQCNISRNQHYWILHYSGDTTGLMPGPLPEVLSALQSGGLAIIIDFTNLRSINRSGVKAVLESIELGKTYNANIGLVSPPPDVRRVLKLNGLTSDTPIYRNVLLAQTKLDLVDYQDSTRMDNTDNLMIVRKELHIGQRLREALNDHPFRPHFRLMIHRDFETGYAKIRRERVDCVLIDAGMPMIQFEKFVEKLQSDSKLPRIPLLVVTPESMLVHAGLMIRHGAHDLIKFPFEGIEAYSRIQMLISFIRENVEFVPAIDTTAAPRR